MAIPRVEGLTCMVFLSVDSLPAKAFAPERRIKGWSRKKKEAIIRDEVGTCCQGYQSVTTWVVEA